MKWRRAFLLLGSRRMANSARTLTEIRRGSSTTARNNIMAMTVPLALESLDYLGTACFAASGTLVAGQVGMDMLGCTLVGTITALGGGTIRDLLLGRTPVFWFTQQRYLLICAGTAILTFFASERLEGLGFLHKNVMWWGDTLGIGAFAVVGAQAAASSGVGPVVCALCGMLTSTCGGLVRDVLCGRDPKLLYSPPVDAPSSAGTLYAPTALAGAAMYTLIGRVATTPLAIAAGFVCTVGLRTAAHLCNVRLPSMARFTASEHQSAPAPKLSPRDAHFFLTAYGCDGIENVMALTSCIADARANISVSKICTVGSDIAATMLVSVPKASIDALVEELRVTGAELGLSIDTHRIKPSKDKGESTTRTARRRDVHARVSFCGPDLPGVTHKILALLAAHRLGILSLETRVYNGDVAELRSLESRDPCTDVFFLNAVVNSKGLPNEERLAADTDVFLKACGPSARLEIDFLPPNNKS